MLMTAIREGNSPMRRYLAAALCLPLVVALSARADDKPLEGDAKKLQGQWTAKAGPDAIPVYLTFDKGKIAFKVTAPTGDEKTISGDFTLDEKSTAPEGDDLERT